MKKMIFEGSTARWVTFPHAVRVTQQLSLHAAFHVSHDQSRAPTYLSTLYFRIMHACAHICEEQDKNDDKSIHTIYLIDAAIKWRDMTCTNMM